MNGSFCPHKKDIKEFPVQDKYECKECMEIGDVWVMLRQCLTCGHVGCCDNSKNKHATKHFEKTNHPIMKSVADTNAVLREEFRWCYVDKMYI